MSDTPITFEAQSFALFDIDANAVLTTRWGNLAIFSVRAVAEQYASESRRNIKVVPVKIAPVTEQ
jgi:hypothetical protein